MPIDVEKARGGAMPSVAATWDTKDVILYHLGLGAGADPLDAGELTYTYERGLKVLPTFAMVVFPSDMEGLLAVPGLDFDPRMLLHGEQELVLHRPLSKRGQVKATPVIADVYDKGKAAVLVIEAEASDDEGPVFTSRGSMFIRGEGGFGGDPGPRTEVTVPDRAPDGVVETPTLPQQALLYRLCGDLNPLHADPSFSSAAGFPRPILHGLCTYGIVCRAVVDHALDGDVARVRRYRARFAGVVFPGETIVTSWWREGSEVIVQASTKERGEPVLTHTVVEFS